jgi:hypothetical protein
MPAVAIAVAIVPVVPTAVALGRGRRRRPGQAADGMLGGARRVLGAGRVRGEGQQRAHRRAYSRQVKSLQVTCPSPPVIGRWVGARYGNARLVIQSFARMENV